MLIFLSLTYPLLPSLSYIHSSFIFMASSHISYPTHLSLSYPTLFSLSYPTLLSLSFLHILSPSSHHFYLDSCPCSSLLALNLSIALTLSSLAMFHILLSSTTLISLKSLLTSLTNLYLMHRKEPVFIFSHAGGTKVAYARTVCAGN